VEWLVFYSVSNKRSFSLLGTGVQKMMDGFIASRAVFCAAQLRGWGSYVKSMVFSCRAGASWNGGYVYLPNFQENEK
jgi:hypothetical protein